MRTVWLALAATLVLSGCTAAPSDLSRAPVATETAEEAVSLTQRLQPPPEALQGAHAELKFKLRRVIDGETLVDGTNVMRDLRAEVAEFNNDVLTVNTERVEQLQKQLGQPFKFTFDSCGESTFACYTPGNDFYVLTPEALKQTDCALMRSLSHEYRHYEQWVAGELDGFTEADRERVEADARAHERGC